MEADGSGAASEGKGAGKGADRPGSVPSEGFLAVKICVSKCTNELTNGIYLPAKPYSGKPVWHKAASEDEPMDGAESKDRGERFIYYSERGEKWFVGDALEEGGFSFVLSPGKAVVPPADGWYNGTSLDFEGEAKEGAVAAAAALIEMTKLGKIEPWADQEICYVTMLKVLNNIVANPTESKFFSLKIENQAIQNKILRHDGARGFLEAVGFREDGGALVLPMDRSAHAKMAHEVLQGFANEMQYQSIRKERHAVAAEEAKKEAERKKYERPAPQGQSGYGGGGGGGRMGGPMRGGGG